MITRMELSREEITEAIKSHLSTWHDLDPASLEVKLTYRQARDGLPSQIVAKVSFRKNDD